MRTLKLLFILCCILLGGTIQPRPTQAQSVTPLQHAANTAVQIFALDRNGEPISSGSGSLVHEQGLVLTNHHVVADSLAARRSVAVHVPLPQGNGRSIALLGTVLIADAAEDLAIVYLQSTAAGESIEGLHFSTVPLGDAEKLTIGEDLYAIGYPDMASGKLMTKGIFSGFGKLDNLTWVLSDVDTSNGNSGGMLVNTLGELVAIPTLVYLGQTGELLSYARPINNARPLLSAAIKWLEENGSVEATPAMTPVPQDATTRCDDTFTSNSRGWDIGQAQGDLTEREERIAGGQLQFSTTFFKDSYSWLTVPDCELQDFVMDIEVAVQSASTADDAVVLLFRHQREDDRLHHYRALFYVDNSFEIDRNDGGDWQTFVERTAHESIDLRSGRTNQLRVVFFGSRLYLFSNGKLLDRIVDESLTDFGEIGIGVKGDAGDEVNVAFDNLQLTDELPSNWYFYDDFLDNRNDWDLGRSVSDEGDIAEDSIANGRLEQRMVIQSETRQGLSIIPELIVQDFMLQADATIIDSNQSGNWLSIFFRQDDDGNYYLLRIEDEQEYIIERFYQEEWTTLQPWTRSSAINLQEGNTNTIQLSVQGKYITIAVNGVELTTVEDTLLSGSGRISLGMGGREGAVTLTAYDNLFIWQAP